MRPILIAIPSKALFFLALVAAAVWFGWDVVRRRRTPGATFSLNPLFLVVGSLFLVRFFSPTANFIPESGTFSQPWQPLPIYSYGVMLGTSMIVGWFLAMRLARQDGISTEDAGAIYMWTAVYSIIGARVLWYLTTPDIPLAELPKVWRGGLVAYGGMIGGFLASWYGCHKRKIHLLQWADVSAPSVVLGTGITRVGCLLFGCDFGARSDLPWAIRFPGPNPMSPHGSPAWQHHVQDLHLPTTAAWSYPVHPTQLYESLTGLLLFALLMFIRHHRKFSGQVFLGWILGYGILRPLIETVRDDEDRGVYAIPLLHLSLSTSQIIGIVSVLLGLVLLVYLVRRYARDPESLRLWQHPAVAGGPSEGAGGGGAAPRKRKRRR
jgi:prolipoprotein diacylglyceryl transferase